MTAKLPAAGWVSGGGVGERCVQALDAIIEMRINHFRSMPSISRSEDLSVSQFFTRVPAAGRALFLGRG